MDDLAAELATVDAVMNSRGMTRRVDALALLWIKVEKQLRRLFCYVVYQHPGIDSTNIDEYVEILVANRDLYPETFVKCFNALSPQPLCSIVGPEYATLWNELGRIKRYRNKLLHGQITGLRISSPQLERDGKLLRRWLTVVATSCETAIGYNGVGRNTFRKAKAGLHVGPSAYPWTEAASFRTWLTTQTRNAPNTR
jgi:hypothetical protein